MKLVTRPATIAYGRRRPPVAPPASRIGSTGSTHGESAVITPGQEGDREEDEHPVPLQSVGVEPVACCGRRRSAASAGRGVAASSARGSRLAPRRASCLLALRCRCRCAPAACGRPALLAACAGAAASGRARSSARAGCRRARPRSPGSCRAARAPPRSAGSRAACSPRPRRAAPRRPRAACSSAALTSLAAFSSCRCPREFASAPSSRFASGYSALARRSCVLRDARASRHVQRARIWSGASGLPSAIARSRMRTPGSAVLLPRSAPASRA